MLDEHGKVAIAQLVLYIPALFCCLWSFIRDGGFGRGNGWIYLLTFCAIRIGGAALVIDVENNPSNLITLLPPATVLNTIALSPLMGSTLSFLRRRSQLQAESGNSLLMRLLKPLHFVIILAVGAGIVGAEDTTKVSADQSTINTGATLLRVANVLFLLIWCALVVATICLWVKPSRLQADQRVILVAVSAALPFILVRTIYSGLNAINLNTSSSSHHNTKFNPISGDWIIYLIMGVLMEITVVAIYITTGMWYWFRHRKNSDASDVELNN